jgi:hypothetical protein
MSEKHLAMKKTRRKFQLPWWCKMVAYFLSVCFAGICIFFIISKGIVFGDAKCSKWATSFVTSFFSEMIVTEPLKIMIISVILVVVFGKEEEEDEFGSDHLDNGGPINNYIVHEDGQPQVDEDELEVSCLF